MANTFLPLARPFFSGATVFCCRVLLFSSATYLAGVTFFSGATFFFGAHLKAAGRFIVGSKCEQVWFCKMVDSAENDLNS